MKTIVLFAHPYFEYSKTSSKLIETYLRHKNVVLRDLYEEYPDFHIPAFRERKRLPEYDHFIFHFPLLWFGIPPLLKLWIDEVFSSKWIKTPQDNPFHGKKATIIVTIGSPKENYLDSQGQEITSRYVSTLSQSLKLIGVEDVQNHWIYATDSITQEQINSHQNEIQKLLQNG